MVPLVEDAVLQNNTEFAALHNTLVTVVLNPDGSTKAHLGAKEMVSMQQNLRNTRVQAAKDYLLAQSLATTAPTEKQAAARKSSYKPNVDTRGAGCAVLSKCSSGTSAALADALLLIPSLVSVCRREKHGPEGDHLSMASARAIELLLAVISSADLLRHAADLADLVSEDLRVSILGLARVANSTANPSYLHRAVPSLPDQISKLQKSANDRRIYLASVRQAASTACLSLLDQQATVVTGLLRALEVKHGPGCRSLELRASEVALAAQAHMLKTQSVSTAIIHATYPPEASAALRTYHAHLQDSKFRLQDAIRERESMLGEYGVSGGYGTPAKDVETGMRDMAKAYSQMSKQVHDMRGDLARLGGTSRHAGR